MKKTQAPCFAVFFTFVGCFPGGSDCNESSCNAGDPGSIPVSGRSPKEELATHYSILPGEDHGQRSLAGYIVHGSQRVGHN